MRKEAIKRIEELAPYDLEFVEQPVAAHDLQGLGYVRQSVSLPVIADENGNLLIDDDPQRGASVVNGKLVLPDGPGLGLQPSR